MIQLGNKFLCTHTVLTEKGQTIGKIFAILLFSGVLVIFYLENLQLDQFCFMNKNEAICQVKGIFEDDEREKSCFSSSSRKAFGINSYRDKFGGYLRTENAGIFSCSMV